MCSVQYEDSFQSIFPNRLVCSLNLPWACQLSVSLDKSALRLPVIGVPAASQVDVEMHAFRCSTELHPGF